MWGSALCSGPNLFNPRKLVAAVTRNDTRARQTMGEEGPTSDGVASPTEALSVVVSGEGRCYLTIISFSRFHPYLQRWLPTQPIPHTFSINSGRYASCKQSGPSSFGAAEARLFQRINKRRVNNSCTSSRELMRGKNARLTIRVRMGTARKFLSARGDDVDVKDPV